MEGAIDYAGLFPPAKLDMADSVANYLRYTHGPERWIVDRFVCSAGRLPELLNELDQHTPEEVSGREPIPVAVVGTAPSDHKHWAQSLEHDRAEIARFRKASERRAEVVAFEIRLPDHKNLAEYLRSLSPVGEFDVFVELPWSDEMPDSLAIIAEIDGPGAKARTGGLEPGSIPSASDLAVFLQSCVQLELPFKCTAGLHVGVRHYDEAVGAKIHGFLNVMGAAVLTDANDLNRKEIEELLNVEDRAAFQVTQDSFGWKDHQANLEQIAEARQLMIGFGSCSVEEPLVELALLAAARI